MYKVETTTQLDYASAYSIRVPKYDGGSVKTFTADDLAIAISPDKSPCGRTMYFSVTHNKYVIESEQMQKNVIPVGIVTNWNPHTQIGHFQYCGLITLYVDGETHTKPMTSWTPWYGLLADDKTQNAVSRCGWIVNTQMKFVRVQIDPA